jgi:glycosidase
MTESQLYKILHSYFPFGFHLSRKSWERYDIQTLLDEFDSTKATYGTYAFRRLADRVNEWHLHSSHVVETVQAGQLISVEVIVDVLRYIAGMYCHDEVPGVIQRGLDWSAKRQSRVTVEKPPLSFVNLFPPLTVMQGQQTEDKYLQESSEGGLNSETVTIEMILLSLVMANPALKPFRILFNDKDLKKQCPYIPFVDSLEMFFDKQPVVSLIGMTLLRCLRAPMNASPDSLEGQLDYMKDHWAKFLPPELLERLLLAADILKEEERLRGLGPGPSLVLQFVKKAYGDDMGYSEPACFSKDADWMSNVVIMAKSVYVWLDQLSKKYQRHIRYLSDVPDEELDRLARWGFTGLWLIGVWERSKASQKIKQNMGNPEAMPSAYSLYDYVISDDLGGETAYQNLRQRAWQRGIRLASDMVPNHVGIYSKWVIEHPNWFIQSDFSPFPCYQFTGEDLSSDPRVAVAIEDGYWEHRDAAVVFKRMDRWTGDVKYIYHGNDGTSMPWNDTAQLNFLLPEVREAVIQTILHVARKFSIIRFDAAMTLAKRHYQRLWFPQPGDGGAIPSRAEHGMSKAEFDHLFPKEFWREVVDRVAEEVPDTLLIAEAFWLMEGYFVRTLGMHRVYNSAFMNMLKMEDNCEYRMTVKNVLEFSPEVLKRFVNFMNNPDEATAVEQFGKGDKYFGIVMLMVTMPGLPMFGHGQIEGFTEKYGMEYRRAYWDERVDDEMVHRHETEIFPLMRRRQLFSGAHNFAFYDFNTPEGWVDENVFAYSNRAGDERAIILYNNAYNTTNGWIHTSTPINIGTGEEKVLVRKTLAEALALNTDEGYFYIFRDYRTGLEYIRGGKQISEEGIFAMLHAYQYNAFLDFKEISDTDGSWMKLLHRLNGNGVPNINETYKEMRLEPVLIPFREVLNADMLRTFNTDNRKARIKFDQAIPHFLIAVKDFVGAEISPEEVLQDVLDEMNALPLEELIKSTRIDDALAIDFKSLIDDKNVEPLMHMAITWITIHHLGRFCSPTDTIDPRALVKSRLEEWLLRKNIAHVFEDFKGDKVSAHFDALLVMILTAYDSLLLPSNKPNIAEAMKRIVKDPFVKEYLQINMHRDITWLNKEQLERMIKALLFVAIIKLQAKNYLNNDTLKHALQTARQILVSAGDAAYQVKKTIQLLSSR